MRSIRAFAAAAALLAALALSVPPPAAAQTVMKLANATINDVQHEWQKMFAAALQKRVGDKVKVEIYPASQLGAIPRMVDGVLLGTIESFITPTSFLVPTDPRFQIYDVPGLFVSPEHVHAVIHDPAYRDHMETMFVNRGLRIIGAIYNSPTVVLTKKPAPTLEGLKGLKIRTFASPLQMEPMKAVGAIPVPLALTEVIPQLQSGGSADPLARSSPPRGAYPFTAKTSESGTSVRVKFRLTNLGPRSPSPQPRTLEVPPAVSCTSRS